MGVQETMDAITGEQAKLQQDIKTQVEQKELSEASTENLKEERAEGRMAMLDFFKKSVDTGQNISSLQRVGLAASAGESESIRLQRRQLFKADSMDKLLFNQNKILNEKL